MWRMLLLRGRRVPFGSPHSRRKDLLPDNLKGHPHSVWPCFAGCPDQKSLPPLGAPKRPPAPTPDPSRGKTWQGRDVVVGRQHNAPPTTVQAGQPARLATALAPDAITTAVGCFPHAAEMSA